MQDLAGVMNAVFLVTTMSWTICVCSWMLVMEKVRYNGNYWSRWPLDTEFLRFQYTGTDFIYDMQMAFVASASAIVLLFVFFNLGQMFHTSLSGLGVTIYQTEWYRYPRCAQFVVLLMIQRTQRSFYLSAFGIMEVNLQNYVGVSMKENGKWQAVAINEIRISWNFISAAQMDLFSIHVIAQLRLIRYRYLDINVIHIKHISTSTLKQTTVRSRKRDA